MLCSGLVDDGRSSQDYIAGDTWNFVLLIISQYPTSWAYSRSIHSHVNGHTTDTTLTQPTESVGSTKEPTRDYRTYPLRNKVPNFHRMLLFDEKPSFSRFHPPLLTERLHANHEIIKEALEATFGATLDDWSLKC